MFGSRFRTKRLCKCHEKTTKNEDTTKDFSSRTRTWVSRTRTWAPRTRTLNYFVFKDQDKNNNSGNNKINSSTFVILEIIRWVEWIYGKERREFKQSVAQTIYSIHAYLVWPCLVHALRPAIREDRLSKIYPIIYSSLDISTLALGGLIHPSGAVQPFRRDARTVSFTYLLLSGTNANAGITWLTLRMVLRAIWLKRA